MDSQKAFLILLTGLLGFISWLMIKPFLAYVLGAVVLAFILHPLQRRMAPRMGPRITAFILVLLAVFAAVLPVTLATAAIIQDASDLPQDVDQSEIIDTAEIEAKILAYTGQQVDIASAVGSAVNEFSNLAFGSFSRVVNVLTNVSIGITIMMFLLFYFLKDGEKLVGWLKSVTPMPQDIQENLYSRVNRTTWAVIKGHVLVAVTQGLVAGLGLFIAGVPNYIFWTFIMILLGFIPIIGTIIVWGPATVYLFLMGSFEAAVFLLVWGLVVVGITDNIMRPLVVDKSAELHPAAILIGVIGGVYIFGAPGLFIGPIIIGVFKSVLLVFRNNYEDL